MYFVIHNSDGDTTVVPYTREELLAELEAGGWKHYTFLNRIPENNDTNYWGDTVLIIKGAIAVPEEEEEVITKYTI